MLVTDQRTLHARVWVLMGDIAQQVVFTKQTLLELAKQVHTLGTGLTNAAPGDKAGLPNPSIQYLTAIADTLEAHAKLCDELSQELAQRK